MNTFENVINAVKSGLKMLSKMPATFKYVTVIGIALACVAAVLGLSSCGNTSKIMIKSDPNNISISVNQTSNDSTAVNVNVNPTLRLYEGKKNETSSR